MASKTIYGGTYNLLAHTLPLTSGITADFADPQEDGAFEQAIRENTKAIFVESLGNPNSNVADPEKLAEIAHSHQIPLVVDSTFATPYLLRPVEYGADLVVHSATKFIGGHGTALGGVIIDSGKFDWKSSGKYPWLSEPNSGYHGISFTDAAPDSVFVTYVRAALKRHRGHAFPISRILFAAGTGDTVPAGRTSCGQRAEDCKISVGSSPGGSSASSFAGKLTDLCVI